MVRRAPGRARGGARHLGTSAPRAGGRAWRGWRRPSSA